MHSWNTPHPATGLRRRHARWGAVLAAVLAGCLGTSDDRLDTAQAAQSSFVAIGSIGHNGNSAGNLNSIDALGWANVHAFDPWAYTGWNAPTPYGFTGTGAWSVALFRPGAAFRYP